MDFTHPEIAARLFNRPAAITESKARVLLSVVAPRLGIGSLRVAWSDHAEDLALADMGDIAATARAETRHRTRTRERLFHMIEGTGVAVIPITGTLVHKNGLDPYSGMTGYDGITAKFRAALSDPAVRAVAFDIDSPGGEVAGLFDLVDEIHGARGEKPIHAIMTEDAYSAAYAIASAADRVVVPRTGGLGSIGVIALHADFSRSLAEAGIEVTAIYAGARKNDGSPYEPLTDAAQARIQADVDALYNIFTATVARNRDMAEAAVRATEAMTFMGPDGIAAGLGDAVMSPADALEALIADASAAAPGAITATAKQEKTMSLLDKIGGRKRAAEDDETPEEETPEAMEDDEEEQAAAGSDSAAEDDADAEGEDAGAEASSFAKGRKAERKRIAGILNSPEARGREALAQSLALDTDMDAASASTVLGKAAKGGGGLAAVMAGVENPDVGPDGDTSGADASVESVAGRIVGKRRNSNQ